MSPRILYIQVLILFLFNTTPDVEVDERSTPQLPIITCMQTPITEREKHKAMEAGIARSIDETFLISKKEIAIIKSE